MANSYEEILQRMEQSIVLPENVSMEGSFSGDILRCVADELARIYSYDVDTIYEKVFVSDAEGENLTKICENYGVERIAAQGSSAMVVFTGEPNAVYEYDPDDIKKVYSSEFAFTVPESIRLSQEGTATVKVYCDETGAQTNVSAQSIQMVGPGLEGLTVNNPEAATGGADEEDDASLRERTLFKMRNPSSSGNKSDYQRWAMEVSGVKKAYVTGPIDQDVTITEDQTSITITPEVVIKVLSDDSAIAEKVAAYIEPKRPVGALVEVEKATPTYIDITVNLRLAAGVSKEAAQSALQDIVGQYIDGIDMETNEISYLKVVSLLFDAEVGDVASLKILKRGDSGEGDESITLDPGEFGVLGTLAVVEVE